MSYQVFISYRRSTGESLAHLLYYRFTCDGYKVFFDVETMRSGKFDQQIYTKIDECTDFVLVLSENALDRCTVEEDWVRLEIEYALQKNKNIIPIFARNFIFPDNLPESIKEIRLFQAVTANSEFFDDVIQKLENMFVSVPQTAGNREKEEILCILDSLFDSTVTYRNALRKGIDDEIHDATSNMVGFLQKLNKICEKERYISSKKNIIQKCAEIIDQFNIFVEYYNTFIHFSNRMSPEAQEYAKFAEDEFMKFVDKICQAIAQQ